MATKIALQLYTLRDFCKTAPDFAASMKKVREIGYEAVQVSGLGAAITMPEVRKILDDSGLKCVATHCGIDRVRDNPQSIIDDLDTLGCRLTAIGGFWPKGDVTAQTWTDFAREYSAAAARFAAAGKLLGYHNHSHELAKYGGQTALDLLFKGFSKDVWMEIDTYWITHGGGDPIAWVNKVAGRIPAIHLKDMAVTPDRQQVMAEVGEGNLNFPGIFQAARAAGVEWYIVEQDSCQRDPFEAVAISLRNVKAMGLS